MALLRLTVSVWLLWVVLSATVPAAMAQVLPPGQPARVSAQDSSDYVAVARLRGIINPAAASYVDRAIGAAETGGARLFVLELDTPGGLDSAMRQIVQRILSSTVPVVVYVAPQGARAGSAGMYITYSAHVAAMAPNTNIGSATPVAMGEGGEAKLSDDMRNKVVNDAVAYVKGLAEARGRNAEWAEDAVRQAVNATAQEALQLGVIDHVAPDLSSLLQAVDGQKVATARGEVVVESAGLRVERIEMQPHEALLHAITDPTVAYLLLSIGSLALIYELANPGAVFPGVVGGIALLVALYALGTLPVNLAGLLLIVFAMGLFVLDLVTPSHGILTAGAIVSFLLGSAILYNTPEGAPVFQVAPQAIIMMTLLLAGSFGIVLGSVVRSHRRPSVTGREGLLGQRGHVRQALDPEGMVFVEGELWTATTVGEPVPVGTAVEVVGVEGLRLHVRPVAAPVPDRAEANRPVAS
jgi:membrane-bound serine protease (ClpP class)